MKRFILVDYENETVVREAFATADEAWREAVRLAQANNCSPYDWTAEEIEVGAL